ncbi:hypothetical protein [Aeromicrobium endophyticum]
MTVLCGKCGRPAGPVDARLISNSLVLVDPDPARQLDTHHCEGL